MRTIASIMFVIDEVSSLNCILPGGFQNISCDVVPRVKAPEISFGNLEGRWFDPGPRPALLFFKQAIISAFDVYNGTKAVCHLVTSSEEARSISIPQSRTPYLALGLLKTNFGGTFFLLNGSLMIHSENTC